jgi:hypothetical protein
MQFFSDMIKTLWDNVGNPEFWAGEVLSWLAFGVIAAGLQWWIADFRDRRANERYRGWTLRTIGYGPQENDFVEESPIYFEDMRRFLSSDFELFKFIRSSCSGVAEVRLRNLGEAKGIWVFKNDELRRITVDFVRMPDDMVDKWKARKPAARPASVPVPADAAD